MTFQLNASLAVDSIANEADVRTLKSALNRLGYYMPYDKTGITDMPDTHMFDALKKFQSEHGLSADGIIRPDGPTFQTIKTALEAGTQNQAYIWKTVKDNRVRGDHAAREGKIFLWNKPPDGGHPAQDYNCRCWAEPVSQQEYWKIVDPPIEPVYPELLLLPALKTKAGINAFRKIIKGPLKMADTGTWPKPPVSGRFMEGVPSRQKPRSRGEKSLYDEQGGEWRYAKEDKYHNPHWDYKRSASSQWENISINGKPTQKVGK